MSSLAPGPAGTTPTSHDLPTRPDGTPLRVLLTARDAVEDRIAGLTAGGDDYVTKPFVLEEVAARLRSLVRHPGRVRSEALILDRVWQYDFAGQGNVVELYVSYLRRTIDAGHAPMIRTVRDAGHVLEPGRSA